MQAKDSCKQNYCLAESCFSKAFSFNLDGAYGLCSVAWIILLQESLSILHDFYSEYKSLNSWNKTNTWLILCDLFFGMVNGEFTWPNNQGCG